VPNRVCLYASIVGLVQHAASKRRHHEIAQLDPVVVYPAMTCMPAVSSPCSVRSPQSCLTWQPQRLME
jgi:hypothetical protein